MRETLPPTIAPSPPALSADEVAQLHLVCDELRVNQKYSTPHAKLDKALAACLAGRVQPTATPGAYLVQSTQPAEGAYETMGGACPCPYGEHHPDERYGCYHSVAAALYARWQQNLAPWFAPVPPTTTPPIPHVQGDRPMAMTALGRSLPSKLTELGRIRIGDREANSAGNGFHPHKLDVFRLTSSNGSLLHFAANLYGGEVTPWNGEGAPRDEQGRPTAFELYTTVNAMDILIPTMSAVTVTFERWSAAGCQQRCTGEQITHCPLNEALIGTACTCTADEEERNTLAKRGKACARILRLNVLLPDLPGMGVWRLETKGYYATAELVGTLQMLQMAGQEHSIIEAVLRLESRTIKRPGKGEGTGTLQFSVPVLWPKYTPRQILAGAAQVLLAAPPPAAPPALPLLVAELYGEVVDPTAPGAAGPEGSTCRETFEAAITAQGGPVEANLARWYAYAERRFQVARAAFTDEQWAHLLEAVHEAERVRAVAHQAPSGTIQESSAEPAVREQSA